MLILSLLVGALAVFAPGASSIDFYIGTYTSPSGSQGIYHSSIDCKTGALSPPTLSVKSENPSYLAFGRGGQCLFAIHEMGEGSVSSYRVLPNCGLELISSQRTQGSGPCHVSLDRTGHHLFSSSYGGGTLVSVPVGSGGELGHPDGLYRNPPPADHPGSKVVSRMHSAYVDAKNRFVYVCDLGLDDVLIYRLDNVTGLLTPADPARAKLANGSGPRHLALHPGGKFAYVNNEYSNDVAAFKIDPDSGSLRHLQTLSTLPAGHDPAGCTTAEILCHPNGKWLYVSNRGHDSFAVFEIEPNGRLKLLEVAPAGVSLPRGMDIDPSGQWLIVGGQASNSVTSLAIDQSTGQLTPSHFVVAVDKPVCITFFHPQG